LAKRDETREMRAGKPPPDALRTWWPELRGRVPERWSRLTNEWLGEVEGRQERLAEKLRDAYGISEAEATRQVEDFLETHWNALSARHLTPSGTTAGDDAINNK